MATGGAQMGEVIQGPWRRSQNPDLMRVLSEEIIRMTRALEDLRELYQRREVVDLPNARDANEK
jgi:hypothetical protein